MGIRKNPTITYMTSAYFTIVMTAMMCSLAHTYVHSANQALARISAMVELCMHAGGNQWQSGPPGADTLIATWLLHTNAYLENSALCVNIGYSKHNDRSP